MAVRLRDLLLGLRELHLGDAPVIVHSSLKSFGEVEGGAQTVVNAHGDGLPERDRADIYLQNHAHATDRTGT